MTKSNIHRPRAREAGLPVPGMPGPLNAITDVSGIKVGAHTLCADEPRQVRTGVTAILPRGFDREARLVWAGQHTLNGNGEMTGTHWIRDGGWFVGPILLTNSHGIGMAHHAATRWMIETYAKYWEMKHLWAMPVVAETYDGVLSDINALPLTVEHALAAIRSAEGGPVAEGNSGGGAGMICYEFKGGTGTASRRIEIEGESFTIGVLVQANHGSRPWLTLLGVPLGEKMNENRIPDMPTECGSIISIIATDLPLSPGQLERLARRATIGVGRGGSPGGNNSGDIFLAFSTANEMPLPQISSPWRQMRTLNDELLDPVYLAAVEAVEEAIINALFAATDTLTVRPPGHVCRAIDIDRVTSLMRQMGRIR